MSWGKAILAVLGPATLIGPMLGVAGGVLFALILALAESEEFLPGFFVAVTFFGGILGVFIATPICLLAGTVLLKLSQRREILARRRVWAGVGAGAGLLAGLLVGLLSEDIGFAVVLSATAAILGALGGWLCRWMVRRQIDALFTVDTEIFR